MRPIGVTLIAIYQVLRGLVGMLFACGILVSAGLALKLAAISAEGNALERWLQGMGHMLGISILVFGLIHVIAGIGLFGMKNWARLLTVLLSAIGLVLLLPVAIVTHGIPLVFVLLNMVSIFYLAMPPMRRTFRGDRAAMRAA